MIPTQLIDDIRERSDIIAVISEYVQLKKRGKNFLGLCPFHSEKTPSFTVSEEKRLFHCFGCGEGGNIFAFIMKAENVDFLESVKILGEKLGVDVSSIGRGAAKDSRATRLLETVSIASQYFQKALRESDAAAPAREYLKKRGITDASVADFKLGYSLDSWDALLKHLTQRGVNPKDIEEAGLVLKNETGGLYDRFRGRLIFTISDHRGKDIGFGARTLKNEEPKYLNSPETPVYNKSRILYGISLSKDHIKRENSALIVEGYMDAIACYQAGIKNVIASMGTALTEDQCKLLSRFTENVILSYDKDTAGEAATLRGVEMLKKYSFNVKVAETEGAKDPDELIREKGLGAMLASIKNARPWMEYRIHDRLKKANLSEIESRVKATRDIAKLISSESDPLVRAEYIKYASAELKANPDTLAEEVKRESFNQGKNIKRTQQRLVSEKPVSKLIKAEEFILKMAIEDPAALKFLKENLRWGEFTDKITRGIAELLSNVDAEGKDLVAFLSDNLPSEEEKKKLSAILLSENPLTDAQRSMKDYVAAIKAHHLKEKIATLRSDIEEAEAKKDLEKVKALHREFSEQNTLLRGM